MSLIYSFVARGSDILADYTEFTGNFANVAAQCLQRLPSSSTKFTYTSEGHTFNYLLDNGFTYCVVATESAGRQVPIACLERIKDEFNKNYGDGKAASASASSLTKQFGPKLKEQMQYCIKNKDQLSKLAKVESQITEVKGVMVDNIEKVLERGEKVEVLVDRTEDLRAQAQDFKSQGRKVKNKMWYKNMKIKLIVFSMLLAIIVVIILAVCLGGNTCGSGSK